MTPLRYIITMLAVALSLAGIAQDAGRTGGSVQSATPEAKPATAPHAYVAPVGREGTRHLTPAAHQVHSGATPVRQPQGAEATSRRAAPRPGHSGPIPARVSRTEPGANKD